MIISDDMMARIKALYTAPFKLCHKKIYIFSGDEMVADFGLSEIHRMRPRGYGRMSKMVDGSELHDAHEHYINKLVDGYSHDSHKCVELLNEAWQFKS